MTNISAWIFSDTLRKITKMPALKNTKQTDWKAATVMINMMLRAWDK